MTEITSPTAAPAGRTGATAAAGASAAAQPASAATPDSAAAQMLLGFWYPALEGRHLRAGEITAVTLLEQALAVGRDAAGRAFALADFCPHRAMPLSFGRIVPCPAAEGGSAPGGSAVECCYHGWQFDAHSGQCRSIPSLVAGANVKVERIFARAYPCEERDGTVWVYLPDPAARDVEPPPVPELQVLSKRYRSIRVSVEFPSDVDQGVLGLLDPAHGPYVHQSWYWRSSHKQRDKEKTFEPIPNGFRMVPHAPSANSTAYKILGVYGQPVTTTIDFELPNRRTETIRCGKWWFIDRTVVTPIRRDLCRLDFWAAWNLFYWVPLVTPIFRAFATRFIAQDQHNAERQAVGLGLISAQTAAQMRESPQQAAPPLSEEVANRPPMILVGDADRQARWYFQLKEAVTLSRRTGQPMVHPLDGPVTLRWRT